MACTSAVDERAAGLRRRESLANPESSVTRAAVRDRKKGPSLRARRPAVRGMPGRCGLCLAARTHRPLCFDHTSSNISNHCELFLNYCLAAWACATGNQTSLASRVHFGGQCEIRVKNL